MKLQMKRAAIRIVGIIIVMCTHMTGICAEEKEMTVFSLEKNMDIFVMASWDVERPILVLHGPDGTSYDMFDDESVVTETTTTRVIQNAPAGDWTATYDKKGNTVFDLHYNETSQGISIKNLEMSEVDNGYTTLTCSVDAPGHSGSYTYEVQAIIGEDTSVGKKLLSGNESNMSDWSCKVNLNQLSSYNGYRLMLIVTANNDNVVIQDQAITQPFDYTNGSESYILDDGLFQIKINPLSQYVEIMDMENSYGRNTYLARVTWETDEASSVFEESVQIPYVSDAENLTVGIRKDISGVYSNEVIYHIDLTQGIVADFEKDDYTATNLSKYPVKLENAKGLSIVVGINGIENELVLEAEMISLNLNEGENDIFIDIMDTSGIVWSFAKELYLDETPPILRLFEDYNQRKIYNSSIVITGEVEPGAALLINGMEVDPDEMGIFVEEVKLKAGNNEISIEATDIAGNKTVYHPIVVRELIQSTGLELMITIVACALAGVFSVLLIAWGIKILKKVPENKGE